MSKLTATCARSEQCTHDIRKKMTRWDVTEELQQRVIDYLTKERYVDDERYARFFINDKTKYNHWGTRKVEQALYLKGISREIYEPLLQEMSDAAYEEILLPLLQRKAKSIKANSDYEARQKLLRFAMQRGFTYDQASRCMEKI